jgi:hypothetical protein
MTVNGPIKGSPANRYLKPQGLFKASADVVRSAERYSRRQELWERRERSDQDDCSRADSYITKDIVKSVEGNMSDFKIAP